MYVCPGTMWLKAQILRPDYPDSNPSSILTSCVTLDKLLNILSFQIPHL